jgi:hypothetical protein
MVGASPSAAPTSRGDQCMATVMDLLSRTLQGMQQGNPNPVTPDSVALQYGSSSQIFYVYIRGRERLTATAYTDGMAGALDRVRPAVTTECGA